MGKYTKNSQEYLIRGQVNGLSFVVSNMHILMPMPVLAVCYLHILIFRFCLSFAVYKYSQQKQGILLFSKTFNI